MFRALKPYLKSSLIIKRTFYEPLRAGLPPVYDKQPEDLSFKQKLRKACRMFKDECKLFVEELTSGYQIYPKTDIVENEIDIVWKFDGTQKSLDQWIVNADKDYGYGHSFAKLELSSYGTGIFYGVLDTRVPKDGRTTDSGYCNITSVPKLKSFKRSCTYDWSKYNELVLQVRGDGRQYLLNILQRSKIDLGRYNASHYVMYTRGGPHWQTVKIPFSKFFTGLKGEIYENQYALPETIITNFGITIADKKPGPFRLEIDYIGLCLNSNILETFAYEEYPVRRTKRNQKNNLFY